MQKLKPFISWLSLAVAILSAYYAYTGIQIAKDSNKIAKEVQESSTNFFLVEKRPYIDVEVVKLEGKYLTITDGEKPEGQFSLKLENLGSLAARDIQVDIYYYDSSLKQYEHTSIVAPSLQKILPGKFNLINIFSFKDGANTTAIAKELKSGKLLMQVEVKYKSDVEDFASFQTVKRFEISTDDVILIGGLGEFR